MGGGSGSPPLLSWLWSKILLKNHVSLRAGINSNSFGPFLEIFLKNHQKNLEVANITEKGTDPGPGKIFRCRKLLGEIFDVEQFQRTYNE